MRTLHANNVEDIALGAAVLGAGGGGDPYIGKLLGMQTIEEHGPIRLITLDEVDDDWLILPSAMMGAPTILVEKLAQGEEIVKAFQDLENHLGKKASATMSIEAGGLNSVTPFSVAGRLGLPLVDCDGMGRAFPEIQMLTATLYGVSASPFAMGDEKGNSAVISAIDNRWTERFARSLTIEMGCSAMIACYATSGKQLKEWAVPGTMTLAENIGAAIRTARQSGRDVIEALRKITGGFEVFKGKIVDVQRRTEMGFARGEAVMEGIDGYQSSSLKLHFQNENIVAEKDGAAIISTPDLIAVLDADSGAPVTTEALRYGFRVAVLGIPCNEKWRTSAGLKLVGPRYFGYDIDYLPVEKRFAR